MSLFATYSSASIRGLQSTNSSSGVPFYYQNQEILPISGNTYFGNSVQVSYDGNFIIVGQPNPGFGAGKSYVYVNNTSTNQYDLQQELSPNASNSNVWQFGEQVCINYNGSIASIGASGYKTGNVEVGGIYVFTKSNTTWTQETVLLSGNANSTRLGTTLALNYSGNLIAAGAEDNVGGSASGAVYLFQKSGNSWSQLQKLKANPISNNQAFGKLTNSKIISISQDVNSNYIAIGAPGENNNQGAVYIFNKSGNNYVQQQQILSPNSQPGFGRSVALNNDGNVLLVGSPDIGTANVGRAIVYNRIGNLWSLSQILYSSQNTIYSSFGEFVATSGSANILYVADRSYPYIGNSFNSNGAVFVFEKLSSYVQNQILTANNSNNDDYFGIISCSDSGNILGITAPLSEISSNANLTTGSLYIFKT